MNGMNFKPFISKLLGSLSDENLATLAGLIDTHSNSFTNRSLVDPSNYLSTSDKGVGLFTIQLDKDTIRTGYLVYNDTYCVLLSYVPTSERIAEFQIDVATKTYSMVKEFLTTDYLRHEVAIRANGAQDNADTKVFEVSNIQNISKDILNELKVGDVVQKITGNQKHAYMVSYKGSGAGEGICLTYVAAGYMETVSYDRSGSNWVYNSTDVTEVGSGGTKIYKHTVQFSGSIDGGDEETIDMIFFIPSQNTQFNYLSTLLNSKKFISAYGISDDSFNRLLLRWSTSDGCTLYFTLDETIWTDGVFTNYEITEC